MIHEGSEPQTQHKHKGLCYHLVNYVILRIMQQIYLHKKLIVNTYSMHIEIEEGGGKRLKRPLHFKINAL